MDTESKSEAGFEAGTVESSRAALDKLKQSLASLEKAGFSPSAIGGGETAKSPDLKLGDQVNNILTEAAAAGMSDRQIKDLLAIYLLPQTGFRPADNLARALTVAKTVGMPPNEMTDMLATLQSTLDQTAKVAGKHQSPGDRLRASLGRLESVGLPPDQIKAIATGTTPAKTTQTGSLRPSGSTPTK